MTGEAKTLFCMGALMSRAHVLGPSGNDELQKVSRSWCAMKERSRYFEIFALQN